MTGHVIRHSVRHLLRRARAIVDRGRQLSKIFVGGVHDCHKPGKSTRARKLSRRLCFQCALCSKSPLPELCGFFVVFLLCE